MASSLSECVLKQEVPPEAVSAVDIVRFYEHDGHEVELGLLIESSRPLARRDCASAVGLNGIV